MRINSQYQETIKNAFISVFGNGNIYLFGSRVDDNKKGGDIDLFIEIDNKRDLFKKKIKFLAKIKRVIGEQNIDIVFNENSNRLIEQEIRKWAIKL